MYYQKLIKNYLFGLANPNQPSYVSFYVNNICQLRCDMCFYWDSMQKKSYHLSTHEIEKIANHLPNLIQLSFTGGEPSLRKDLAKVVNIFCKKSNPAMVSIITNGFLTDRITEQTEQILSENKNNYFRLCVSIDGTQKVHDNIRGIEGSFDKAMLTIDSLLKLRNKFANLSVDINTTVSKYNYQNIETLQNFITDIPIDHHSVTIARGKTKESDAKDIPIEAEKLILEKINKTNQSRKTLYHKAINSMRNICYKEIQRIIVEKKYKYPCLAGKKYCTIYQDGSVHTCEILQNLHNINSKLGKLQDFEFDIKKLLKSTNAQELKKWIKHNKCFCSFECVRSIDSIYNHHLLYEIVKDLLK